jgi:hypothetical protein
MGLLLLSLVPLAAIATRAQDAPQQTNDEKLQELIKQVQELQAQVKALEAKQANAAATVPAAAPAPAPAPAPEPIAEEPAYTPPAGIKLRLFGDVGYTASDLKGTTDTFYLGSADLFMTGNLSDRVSILGDVLFTSEPSDNSVSVDVERLYLSYRQNDYFKFTMGRLHTSIGYYVPTFQRGEWFQTAIGPPFMYAFDDEGGAFPLQDVGASLSGKIPSGKFGLEYVAEVANGADHSFGSEIVQNDHDRNNGKAINFALSSHPAAISGLDVGVSFYHDYLTFDDPIDHSEMIATVHAVWTNSKYEFLNEAELVRHVGTITGLPGTFNTPAFYTQFSRAFGKYRPYFRYQYFNSGIDDPVYNNPEIGTTLGRRNGPSFGLRFDFNDHAAAKLQYDHFSYRGLETGNPRAVQTSNALGTEISFAY